MEPRVAVLPYGTPWPRGLARVPLDRLIWPRGAPPGTGVVGDLGPSDHLIAFPSTALMLAPHPGLRARLTLMIAEPRANEPGWRGLRR